MRHSKVTHLAGLLAVTAVALVACALQPAVTPTATPLPPTATPSATATSSPTATPTRVPTSTATPTLTPTFTATFTPSPTDTQTPTPDPLAGAILMLNDLPKGFTAITDAERARLHFSDDEIARSYGKAFSNAQLHNAAGFVDSDQANFQIMLAYLFYPLSKLEQGTLDLSLADPALFEKAFVLGAGQAGQGANVTAKVLAGMDKFGDRSVGVGALLTSAVGMKLHLDIVAVRRGYVFEVYNSIYPDTTKPPAGLANVVKILDARVASVVTAK